MFNIQFLRRTDVYQIDLITKTIDYFSEVMNLFLKSICNQLRYEMCNLLICEILNGIMY